MANATKRAIRFAELVKTSGKPESIALWTDPKQNRAFQKAVKENRVLTVIQGPLPKKKDFGRIGFHPGPHASYLVFPDPLPEDPRSRVVGIKYELTAQPKVTDPVSKAALKARPIPKKPEPAAETPGPAEKEARPIEKSFTVILRRVAVIETSVEVPARSKNQAAQRAVEAVKKEPFDLSKAIQRTEVKSVQ